MVSSMLHGVSQPLANVLVCLSSSGLFRLSRALQFNLEPCKW